MEFFTIFLVISIVYGVLLFFDRFFKSCMFLPYEYLLHRLGLKIGFLYIQWHTTVFNRCLVYLGKSTTSLIGGGLNSVRGRFDGVRNLLVQLFYSLGVLCTLTLLPLVLLLFIDTVFTGLQTITVSQQTDDDDSNHEERISDSSAGKSLQMEILLPGVTLPLNEIGYYLITMILATVVHELGHALAALAEDVPVTGFGFYLYFCVPMPYTEISMDHLNGLRWLRRLRVLCAGIWHNLVFAGFCYLLLSTLGVMFSPFYTLNNYVMVTEVRPDSGLLPTGKDEQRQVREGDIITHINDCRVLDTESWYKCLAQSLQKRPSYCVSSDFIRLNDESVETSHHAPDGHLQCCDQNNRNVCCFEHSGDDLNNDTPMEIPQHVCLDVWHTVKESHGYCGSYFNRHHCSRGFCLKPLLRNSTAILNLRRQTNRPDANENIPMMEDVVYYGHPLEVSRSIRVSPFVPKHSYVMAPHWIDSYTLFLKYNVVFSLGLAFINTLPCLGFDGHHITGTLIHSFLGNRFPDRSRRDLINVIVTAFGTLIFALAILKVLWVSVINSYRTSAITN